MPANYVLLERIELNASASSISFTNIPQTGYTDLKIVVSVRESSATNAGDVVGYMRFNADTGTANYSTRAIYGDGSTVGSLTNSGGAFEIDRSTDTANTFASNEIYIPNYTGSTAKSWSSDMVTETNATGAFAAMYASLWTGTAAITTITLSPRGSLSFAANSTFSLYGLAALGTTPVIAPKATGGSIYTDGTYWYHAFRTSGTFTPQTSLSCDVLQVAGGGGGQAGGGGAGGLAYTSSNSLSATNYTVTIGAGGANTVSGSNSQFGALTAAVGGGGASSWGTAGQNGGSGGGGGSVSGTVVNGGTGTAGQGNNGGTGVSERAGGGGGAGAVGSNGVGGGSGGAGGVGSSTYSSWGAATISGQNSSGTYYYAGGGGGGANGTGGAGGLGGGGTGSNASPTAGTVNTGGGGGGAYNAAGQPGGSGIVIIRYAV